MPRQRDPLANFLTLKTLPKDAVDRVLAGLSDEIARQIDLLTSLREKVADAVTDTEERVNHIQECVSRLMDEAKDGEGDIINPDIEEAVDWLESEGVPQIDDLEGTLENMDEVVVGLQQRRDELAAIIEATPKQGFYENRDEDEEEDDEEDEDEA